LGILLQGRGATRIAVERRFGEGSILDLASLAVTFAATSTEFIAEGQQRCKVFVNLAEIINQSRRSLT
jgi:hypothetical protein